MILQVDPFTGDDRFVRRCAPIPKLGQLPQKSAGTGLKRSFFLKVDVKEIDGGVRRGDIIFALAKSLNVYMIRCPLCYDLLFAISSNTIFSQLYSEYKTAR